MKGETVQPVNLNGYHSIEARIYNYQNIVEWMACNRDVLLYFYLHLNIYKLLVIK